MSDYRDWARKAYQARVDIGGLDGFVPNIEFHASLASVRELSAAVPWDDGGEPPTDEALLSLPLMLLGQVLRIDDSVPHGEIVAVRVEGA